MNKKRIFLFIILCFLLLGAPLVTMAAEVQEAQEVQKVEQEQEQEQPQDREQKQKININGGGISSNKIHIKATVKGHKVTLRTPQLSKNKYLKLVNLVF